MLASILFAAAFKEVGLVAAVSTSTENRLSGSPPPNHHHRSRFGIAAMTGVQQSVANAKFQPLLFFLNPMPSIFGDDTATDQNCRPEPTH
jgi:hypothetical protein